MARPTDDRWLWLGLGVFFFFAVRGMRRAVADLVELTEVEPEQYACEGKKQDQLEDSISLHHLKTLVDSPIPSISTAATSLVVARFARLPNSLQMLTKDLQSGNPRARDRARRAIHYLRDFPPPPGTNRFAIDPQGYTSPATGQDEDWMSQDYDDASPTGMMAFSRRLTHEIGGAACDTGWSDAFNDRDIIVPVVPHQIAGWTSVSPSTQNVDENQRRPAERRQRHREAVVVYENANLRD